MLQRERIVRLLLEEQFYIPVLGLFLRREVQVVVKVNAFHELVRQLLKVNLCFSALLIGLTFL